MGGPEGRPSVEVVDVHNYDAWNFKSTIPGDILSTVTIRGGSKLNDASQITGDCLVTISRTQTTVKAAVQMGFLGRDAQGGFFDPSSARQAVAPAGAG